MRVFIVPQSVLSRQHCASGIPPSLAKVVVSHAAWLSHPPTTHTPGPGRALQPAACPGMCHGQGWGHGTAGVEVQPDMMMLHGGTGCCPEGRRVQEGCASPTLGEKRMALGMPLSSCRQRCPWAFRPQHSPLLLETARCSEPTLLLLLMAAGVQATEPGTTSCRIFLPALPSQQPSPGAAARQDLARCRDSPAALRGDEQGGRGSQLGDTGHLWQLSPCCQLPSQGPSEHRAPWQQLLRGIIPSWRAARAERSAGGGAAVVRSIFASCPPPKNPRRDAALGSAAGHGLGPLRPQEASLPPPPPPPLGNPCPGDAGLQQCVGPCSSGEQLQHPKVGTDHRSPQSPGIPRRGWGALQGSQSSILCSILRAPPRHPKAGLLPDPIPPSGGVFWGRSGWVRCNGTGMD